jgi:RTX calcium-binding nonapeptide repeat (4 copies)
VRKERAMSRVVLWVALAFVLFPAMVIATARADAREIHGTYKHEWTPGIHRNDPPCSKAVPCTRDIIGTTSEDRIFGHSGWDYVVSRQGQDRVWGGRNMDQLYGNSGADRLIGQYGHDHLFGNEGRDYLSTADGVDEPGHVEHILGDSAEPAPEAFDKCVLDEDSREGIILVDCELVVIKGVAGMDGKTPVFEGIAAHAENQPSYFLTPGEYRL